MSRPLALLALLVLASSAAGPAAAQTVESIYSVMLTAKRTETGPRGDRIRLVRITTRDLIEQFREALDGVEGRRMQLVVQRSIGDLAFGDAREFLVVDGQYYPVGGTSEALPMPRSFYGRSGQSTRRPGWPDSQFIEEAVGMFRMGDAVSGRGEFVFSALTQRVARLLVQQGVPVGYLHARLTWSVNGSLVDAQGTAMPVSGRLALGPERLLP